jgi:deoxyribodipyrimidine photolyase
MIGTLPEHLGERTRLRNSVVAPQGPGPVVVWLKSSFRLHENPAIEVGRCIASEHDRPLLIYHGIDERYPHASLRHHTVLLDAAVDMEEGCRKAGLRYVLHMARDGHRPSVMKAFSQSASCIITDLFPLPPWTDWVDSIAASATCPVLDVDCHCVIPMPLFGKSVDRPFKFRDATKKMRKKRLQATWPACNAKPEPYTGPLPFEPINVLEDIKDMKRRFDLLRSCSIDPSVLPVWNERGGEQVALGKWQRFYDKGLNGYARRRNNAADPSGVSRLSAAFHYGFLSPMRVAREAAAIGTKSADKYLDELLIFREHPWHHIFAASDPYAASNLPDWALQSWRETSDDPRVVRLKDHEMEYAHSPLELWNLCQRSLLRHGELHNNLRMTWGKAVPLWTESLEHSLYIGQTLNDKYALDGRDPSSVVGVQWCHGLFDRPFFPSMPVMGVVRKRDVVTHETRLDTHAYDAHINRNPSAYEGVYLVIGTDIAATCIARMLHDHGIKVQMVEHEQEVACKESMFEATDANMFPVWMEERVASMCEQSGTNTVGDVAQQLQKGIEVVNMNKVESLSTIVHDCRAYSDFSVSSAKQIDGRMWQAVNKIWSMNASIKLKNGSIQTRLM